MKIEDIDKEVGDTRKRIEAFLCSRPDEVFYIDGLQDEFSLTKPGIKYHTDNSDKISSIRLKNRVLYGSNEAIKALKGRFYED